MVQPLCPLPVALAQLLKNKLLEPDQPQPSKTELTCSSQGRRTETKPSPCSAPRSLRAPRSIKSVSMSLQHPGEREHRELRGSSQRW